MKQIEKIAEGAAYTCVSVGEMATLGEHILALGPDVKIPGKVFAGGALQATGAEISFQSFPVCGQTGFLHTHKEHEELYIFIKGQGEFQVDGQNFPVAEGSIVRVAPEGKRMVRNTGEETLVMICVQYTAATFSEKDAADGVILAEEFKW